MQILQTLISVLLLHLSLVASSANQGSRNTQCGATFRSLSDFVLSEGPICPKRIWQNPEAMLEDDAMITHTECTAVP
jgi:hypothetical protein